MSAVVYLTFGQHVLLLNLWIGQNRSTLVSRHRLRPVLLCKTSQPNRWQFKHKSSVHLWLGFVFFAILCRRESAYIMLEALEAWIRQIKYPSSLDACPIKGTSAVRGLEMNRQGRGGGALIDAQLVMTPSTHTYHSRRSSQCPKENLSLGPRTCNNLQMLPTLHSRLLHSDTEHRPFTQ